MSGVFSAPDSGLNVAIDDGTNTRRSRFFASSSTFRMPVMCTSIARVGFSSHAIACSELLCTIQLMFFSTVRVARLPYCSTSAYSKGPSLNFSDGITMSLEITLSVPKAPRNSFTCAMPIVPRLPVTRILGLLPAAVSIILF